MMDLACGYVLDDSTKAAVMQIVEQTKRRSGWRVYRTLAALAVPRSVYYAWKGRDNLEDQTAKPCRVYEVLPRGARGDLRVCLAVPDERLHATLGYMTPAIWHRGQPEELRDERARRIAAARAHRRMTNQQRFTEAA